MRGTAGRLEPLALDRPVEESLLREIETGLAGLVSRRDQATNMTALMAAVPFCALEEAYNVAKLQRVVPPPRTATARQLRHVLDAGAWSVEDLRVELLGCAITAGVEAMFLECHEVRPKEADAYDVVSLSLLGSGSCLPVVWRRAWVPPEGSSGEADIERFERDAVAALLAQLCEDLEQLCLAPDFAPLLTTDWRYGEMAGLRNDLAALGFEYLLEVGPVYNGLGEARYPDDSLAVRSELIEQIRFGPHGEPPDPRPLREVPESAPGGELIVSYHGPKGPTYAIARPRVDVRPGGILGHRALRRASALGELIAGAGPPQAAINLRVAQFRHAFEPGWQAGVILMSTLYGALQGLFPEGSF
jgi:hypothetical protein